MTREVYRAVIIRDDGTILRYMRCQTSPREPWIVIDEPEDQARLDRNPFRYLVKNGRLVEQIEVRLTADVETFIPPDCAKVMIVGDWEHLSPLAITINGEPLELPFGEVITIEAPDDEPQSWRIMITDPRVVWQKSLIVRSRGRDDVTEA